MTTPETAALAAIAGTGLEHEVVTYPRVRSIEEAAQHRGVPVAAIVKTLVVRRGEGDYVLVLVPGDRVIDWPKLRSHLGVSRLSLPDPEEARDATGYERGAITPFGAEGDWPVIADAALAGSGVASIGGGAHGIAIHADADALIALCEAEIADVTRPGLSAAHPSP